MDLDQDRFERIGTELVESAEADLEPWLLTLIESRFGGLPADGAGERLARQISARVVADLRLLVGTAADAQRTTPLSVVRVGVAPLTDWLERAGVPPPVRDRDAQRLHPDDRFDLGPGSFEEISPRLQAAGISWGAAKAYMHLKGRPHTT